jgi:hypothetical protein
MYRKERERQNKRKKNKIDPRVSEDKEWVCSMIRAMAVVVQPNESAWPFSLPTS